MEYFLDIRDIVEKMKVNQEACKNQDDDLKEETEENYPAILNRVNTINAEVEVRLFIT